MKRAALTIGALVLLSFGASPARAQSEPTWVGVAPAGQVAASPVWNEDQLLRAVPLSLALTSTCDTTLNHPSTDQACRKQIRDFKVGMRARNEHRADDVAFDNGDDDQDGVRLDGLKVKAYHRF